MSDLFLGLSLPKIPVTKEDDKEMNVFLTQLLKFLNEMLLKAKTWGGVNTTVTVVSDIRTDSGQLQKKTKLVTMRDGYILSIGTESDWTDCGAV